MTAQARISRRHMIAGLGVAAAYPAARARAEPWLRQDIVVYTDPTLKPVLAAIARQFQSKTGVKLRIFTGQPPLLVALLQHNTQDDVLITLAPAIQAAIDSGVVRPGPRALWQNRLTIATAAPASAEIPFDHDAAMRALGDGRFAATDSGPTSSIDGPAVLEKLGIAGPLAPLLVGAANTNDVAFLIRTKAARLGLCHITDATADARLAPAFHVPASAHAPILYQVGLTKSAWSAHQDAFLAFLQSPEAAETARNAGLEIAS